MSQNKLRLSAGFFKGRGLQVPAGIRPTEGKVRQALFNILSGVLPEARVLDLFAGSGSLGLEALSQGAQHASFVEQDTEAILCIRDNLAKLAQTLPRSAWRVMHLDAIRAIHRLNRDQEAFDLVFMDPPYEAEDGKNALKALGDSDILKSSGLLALEHDRRVQMPNTAGTLRLWKQHRYGKTVLSFYEHASALSRDV